MLLAAAALVVFVVAACQDSERDRGFDEHAALP
jgi:hypothetical protein